MRQRCTNWISEVELAKTGQIAAAETLSVAYAQITAKAFKQALPVDRPGLAFLLKLDNVMSNLPVGLGDVDIDGLSRPCLTCGVNLGDFSQQALVTVVCDEIAAAHGRLFMMVIGERCGEVLSDL